jgi:hypothetical protein
MNRDWKYRLGTINGAYGAQNKLKSIPPSAEEKEAKELTSLLLRLPDVRFISYVAGPDWEWNGFQAFVQRLPTLQSQLRVHVKPRLFHAIEEMDLGCRYPNSWQDFLPYAATLPRLKTLRLLILQ